jgi:hypothetical protein
LVPRLSREQVELSFGFATVAEGRLAFRRFRRLQTPTGVIGGVWLGRLKTVCRAFEARLNKDHRLMAYPSRCGYSDTGDHHRGHAAACFPLERGKARGKRSQCHIDTVVDASEHPAYGERQDDPEPCTTGAARREPFPLKSAERCESLSCDSGIHRAGLSLLTVWGNVLRL